jgi:hypothetical protein
MQVLGDGRRKSGPGAVHCFAMQVTGYGAEDWAQGTGVVFAVGFLVITQHPTNQPRKRNHLRLKTHYPRPIARSHLRPPAPTPGRARLLSPSPNTQDPSPLSPSWPPCLLSPITQNLSPTTHRQDTFAGMTTTDLTPANDNRPRIEISAFRCACARRPFSSAACRTASTPSSLARCSRSRL